MNVISVLYEVRIYVNEGSVILEELGCWEGAENCVKMKMEYMEYELWYDSN